MKIRIFALAKELGVDSKDLIQQCNDAGLDVKSSPLASITPAERDVLMDYLRKLNSQPGGGTATAELSPQSREELRREIAGREIRDLGPLAQMRTRRAPPPREATAIPDGKVAVEVETQPLEEEIAAEEVAAPVAAEAVEVEAAVERPPVAPLAPAAEKTAPAAVAPVAKPAERVVPAAPVAPPLPVMAPVSRPVPLSRSDYINPAGGNASIREMKPHGSVRVADDRPPARPAAPAPTPAAEDRSAPVRQNKKRGPALPSLATPNFKPPVIKKTEELVQKPDLALTGDVLKKNKLADILKKNRDDATRRPTVEEEEATPAKGAPGKSARGLGLEEAREARRRRRQKGKGGEDDENVIVKTVKRQRRGSQSTERKSSAVISLPITVRSMSEAMGRPARDLLTVLFSQGKMVTINDQLDEETAMEIAMELGIELEIEQEADFEDALADRLSDEENTDMETVTRPPIITVLGHVDHGKTTLVDRIRSSNVAAGEAGGITQHIAAYQVEHNGQKLTFVDTPGHAAFGEMRARGANVTDIIVLVVAADDGVMPQTVECISHAKAAGVPIVVAMNKCDLPGINEQRILTELSQHGVLPSEWGGDVEVIRVSALQGTGIDNLLETLLLTAELADLRSPVNAPADGVCLEAFRDEGRGPIAWGIVRQGTLKVGDLALCGPAYGRIRAMYTDKGVEIQSAGPSTPVKIAGLNEVPGAGDHLFVMTDIDEAREIAEQRRVRGRTAALSGRGGPKSLEDFFAGRDGAIKDLPLIIKADTPGSLEAIRGELEKFEHAEVRIKILHMGVGGVNESDVYLAASAGAIIIAFHVVAEDRAEALAGQEAVEIRRYKIIYNVTSDIRQALEGLLEPEKVEVATGRALVLRTFSISRVGTVAGCRVLNGTIDRTNRVHVIRDQTILNNYAIASLKREKDDAREVREGFECGIRLDGFNDIKEGDLLEAYKIEQRKRSLEE
ncbi:translation initiation factor IF-2 [Planctomicrobium piriforme]|uniref:Translation initiation factor IF-2 n=1 Tax=Planctomicrobium piriforme TaxID=1576369 RepID=A0A1I3D4G3_9PLAN|nr:translation initiation factor IF-2 [Planctomicrobium piriforme]SFH81381.1 translation initiation factor IF-2 [Planctomicrobium piriforme]